MNRLIGAMSILACFGFLAPAFAQDNAFHEIQNQMMKCGQPQFLLVSEVDMKARNLTGSFAIQESALGNDAVGLGGRELKLADIKVTNARRVVVEEASLPKLKGQLVVLYCREEPLGAAFLSLFREDVIVISWTPQEE